MTSTLFVVFLLVACGDQADVEILSTRDLGPLQTNDASDSVVAFAPGGE